MRAAAALLLVLGACGDDGAPPPERELLRDVKALQDLMAQDPTIGVLAEIDREVDEERPVRASEMIANAGLPAARRQIEAAEGVETVTTRGRALRDRLVAIYRKRAEGLEAYGVALARGVVEDVQLLDAMQKQREAEIELTDFSLELSELRPLREGDPARQRVIRDPRDRE